MYIIYQCYGGTHSSVVAANIHLNKFSMGRAPQFSEILQVPHFDRLESRQIGALSYMGVDEQGHQVFALGSSSKGNEVKKIMRELLPVLGISAEKIAIINCLDQVNVLARIGGFTSRYIGLVALGRPLVALGIRLRYRALVEKVQSFKEDMASYIL
ncbi:MAG: DUF3189 family protein [Dethiobacteria bacterium]